METLPVRPERLAQLEEFARRRGRSTADALDDALADYLEWERQDYQEAVDGIRQGYEDVKAGRTEPAEQFLDEFARSMDFHVELAEQAQHDIASIYDWLQSQRRWRSG